MAPKVMINLRAKRKDVEFIDQAAGLRGQSRSAFIREAAEKEAIKIMSRAAIDAARKAKP
jgi:uncharacterized protein (DUF1778 family)